jgi:hypothetical protein
VVPFPFEVTCQLGGWLAGNHLRLLTIEGTLPKHALRTTPAHYQKLLTQQLRQIQQHGNPKHYGKHFPRYLLTCLQKWMHHNQHTLYNQLKHASHSVEQIASGIAAQAQKFLQIDSDKWSDYRREGIVLPYVNPYSAGVVYKRTDLECLLKDTSCPNNN